MGLCGVRTCRLPFHLVFPTFPPSLVRALKGDPLSYSLPCGRELASLGRNGDKPLRLTAKGSPFTGRHSEADHFSHSGRIGQFHYFLCSVQSVSGDRRKTFFRKKLFHFSLFQKLFPIFFFEFIFSNKFMRQLRSVPWATMSVGAKRSKGCTCATIVRTLGHCPIG